MAWQPASAAAAFLCNPLSVAACVGGSAACLEVTAVMAALAGGALGNPALAGAGLAGAAYLAPHHALLLVPSPSPPHPPPPLPSPLHLPAP